MPAQSTNGRDIFFWEGVMLQSIMTVLVVAFALLAIAGHVALLQALIPPRKTR